jgi:hypothetical protein
MPEINLGIGRFQSIVSSTPQELLGWFDAHGTRYPTPEEQAARSAEQAARSAERAARLAERLRELGEDPDPI